MAAQSTGAVLLASGDAERGLASLREAWTTWQNLNAHYEAARVRVLVGQACTVLGDGDTANMHLRAATSVFERLGAAPDVSRVRGGGPSGDVPVAHLSDRERQVLGLVALGKTNRRIAADLCISEHTVARHVSNILQKIGVTTRTSATAFAFEHGLAQTSVDRINSKD